MARVLVVDDSADLRELIRTFVEAAGHEPTLCDSAAAARAAYQRSRPDAIICDVDMPGETGIAMLIRLRLDEPDFRTPVLFVTAHPERIGPVRKSAPELVDVVAKPFRREQLLSALRRLVG